MKQLLCVVLSLTIVTVAKAQPVRDSVVAVVKNLFLGMKMADTALLRSCFSENAVMQTIIREGDIVKVSGENISSFIDFVGKQAVGAADEQIIFEDIKIDGPLAMVWTPYQFFYKEKFSHCGVNSFQLVRLNTGWKIQYIIDTRKKDGCK